MKQLIPHELRDRTISNIITLCVGAVLAAALLYMGTLLGFIQSIGQAISPFLIGFAVSFLLLPIVSRVELFFNKLFSRKKPHPRLSRGLAVAVAFIVLLALLSGFFAILLPQLITSVKSILQYLTSFVNRNSDTINQLLLKYEFLSFDGEQLVVAWENVVSQLMNYTSLLVNNVMAIGNGIYTLVFQVFVGFIAAFYLLMDKELFCAQVKKTCYSLLKKTTCERLIFWTRRAHRIFAGFITGKIIDSMIIGVICYVCMVIFRIEFPLLISVLVSFTNVIPFFGPFIGAVPSILILLLVNPPSALWFLVFIIILQQLDGNVIGPFVLGDYVGLSPFWIMLSIVVGGKLFGFIGMLVSVPVFALFYAIARTVVDGRLREKQMPPETNYYLDIPAKTPEEKHL